MSVGRSAGRKKGKEKNVLVNCTCQGGPWEMALPSERARLYLRLREDKGSIIAARCLILDVRHKKSLLVVIRWNCTQIFAYLQEAAIRQITLGDSANAYSVVIT